VTVVPFERDTKRSMEFRIHDAWSVAANRLIAITTPSAVRAWTMRTQGDDVDVHLDVIGKHHRHSHRPTNVDREWLERRDGHGADVAGGSVGAT
jgi:hypothetical protein